MGNKSSIDMNAPYQRVNCGVNPGKGSNVTLMYSCGSDASDFRWEWQQTGSGHIARFRYRGGGVIKGNDSATIQAASRVGKRSAGKEGPFYKVVLTNPDGVDFSSAL